MILSGQAKKRQYDQEVENLEKKQKQTIERLEQDHTSRLRDEAKRIKGEQDKELSKFQNMLKNRKKEVRACMTVTAWSWNPRELGIIQYTPACGGYTLLFVFCCVV